MRARGLTVLAFFAVTASTGCMSAPISYERVEDSPLWVNNDQLSALVADGKTEALVLFPPIPLPAKGCVYDCQFIAVWFNEDGRAVRAGSGRMNFEIAPMLTQQSLSGVPAPFICLPNLVKEPK
jgi:hypothetical protein